MITKKMKLNKFVYRAIPTNKSYIANFSGHINQKDLEYSGDAIQGRPMSKNELLSAGVKSLAKSELEKKRKQRVEEINKLLDQAAENQ